MIEKIMDYCKTKKSFVFDNEFSIYELILKILEKVNEIIDFLNNREDNIQKQLDKKEDSVNITNNRKLSPNGDFTGTIHGENSFTMLSEIDDNGDKIEYLTNQFSDGQTGLVVDGGFFTEDGIRNNYDGGVF